MLTAAWHMLRKGAEWHELGAAQIDRADGAKTANRLSDSGEQRPDSLICNRQRTCKGPTHR